MSDTKARILVWFSCGAASAVAAKETIRIYGDSHRVVVVNCDTRPSEDNDNYRFSADCELWLGCPIVYISNPKYANVDEVFEKTRFMSGISGARCTTELKKLPRHEFAKPEDFHVFGFTADSKEQKRAKAFALRNPELRLLWPLIDLHITKDDCYQIVSSAGILLPRMYRLGYDHNNCPGCVKAASPWYWDKIRTDYPEVFERRCKQSRDLGVRLVRLGEERIFLDQLPSGPFRKVTEVLSCGPECGQQSMIFR